jgi:hypothetical protein
MAVGPNGPPTIRQVFFGGAYREPGPALPGGNQIVDPGGRFVFEAPWPWFELPPAVASNPAERGADKDLYLAAPRTDGRDVGLHLFADLAPPSLDSMSPTRVMRRLVQGTSLSVRRVERLLVGGERALFADAMDRREPQHTTFVLLAPREGVCVCGRADVPAMQAAGYRSHLLSMLATWRWLD